MATQSGDRHTVRIGGDAAGPVVVGRGNHVEVTHPATTVPDEASPTPTPADGTGAPQPPGPDTGSTQNNTASGHSTIYTVMNGELNIHRQDDERS
jgi:hypothetical protein